MHASAMASGRRFFEAYAQPGDSILEIGSMDVNGSLREVAPLGSDYMGVDISSGPGVDYVMSNAHSLPFERSSYDLVISSSCLEHDTMFWLTFSEMARVARRFVYVSAPVQGPVHDHPVDCWRFYPDAGLALAEWARHRGIQLKLLESFTIPKPVNDYWSDFVAVFVKNGALRPLRGCAPENAIEIRKG